MNNLTSNRIRSISILTVLFLWAIPFYNPSHAQSGGCGFGISYTGWFTGMPPSVAFNPAGNLVMVSCGSGGTYGSQPGSMNGIYVETICNISDTSLNLSLNTQQSNNNTSAGWGGATFLSNGGSFYTGNSRYRSPSGVVTFLYGNQSTAIYGKSMNRDTLVYYISDGALKFANHSNPEAPVTGTIPTTNLIAGGFHINQGTSIATMGNRIYMEVYKDVNNPTRIRCIDFGGNTCPNYQEVVISTGTTSDIQIRPTDSLIFARTISMTTDGSGYEEPEAGGVVIFNKNGVLQNNFNFTDLSLLAQSPKSNALNIIRFDAAGNIFANISGSAQNNSNGAEMASQVGIVKFDPHGNFDLGFYRNMLNSYSRALYSASNYFDVNQVTGMIVSSLTYFNAGGAYHAKLGGEHVHGNDQNWFSNFPDNGTGGGNSNAVNGSDVSYNSGYNSVHFYYNNGKLKVPNEDAGISGSNCGTQPVATITNSPLAHGTIQCNTMAFIQSPDSGIATTLVLKVSINVDTVGVFKPITVSGSGITLQDPNSSFNATHTGMNDFYLTLNYDGVSAINNCTVNVTNAGSCTSALNDLTKKKRVPFYIWTPQNCTYKAVGPDLK